jgi:DNA-binding transcriptional LysR family regulator
MHDVASKHMSHYIEQLREQNGALKWIGVECYDFHKSWTKQACEGPSHNLYSDHTLLTLSAIRKGLGVSFLPCFMGDADPMLKRYCAPDRAHDLGLWLLLHPELKRNARTLAFRDHMLHSINELRDLFEGHCPAA